jgi:Acyl-CoA synthetases (AMP-forming)/AMP-acid ligases II
MPYHNVAEFLILNANRYPQKTAVIFRDRRLTYQDLNQKINCIANGLLELGIVPGDKVGYLLPNSNILIEVYYAIQKIGAVAVPLNSRIIAREIEFLINNGECRALIFAASFANKMKEIKKNLNVEFLISTGETDCSDYSLEKVAALGDIYEPMIFRDENAPSRIQFTGGTTGLPKGVVRTHYAEISQMLGGLISNCLGANPDEVVLIQCPLDHHGGHSWFNYTLSAGGTLVICDSLNLDEILSLIEREKVTYLMLLPPSTYLRLLECPALANYDLNSVKLVQSSAGYASPEIIKRICTCFPNCRMKYGWGQTESGLGTSLIFTVEMVEKEVPELTSVGKPMPLIELKIVDENDHEVGAGEIGECLSRGPAAMSGYYKQPELTEACIRYDGWLHTGDLMKRDENDYFYLVSRKKNMIKTGGENVFTQEVENVIRQHPVVVDCIVFGIPDRSVGEAVVAVVQLHDGCSMDLQELQDHCKKYLSSYKKPRYADFVSALPMDEAGKIPTYKLQELYKERLKKRSN